MKLCISLLFVSLLSFAVEPFTNVTKEVGLERMGGGTAQWVDVDADGWVDLHDGKTLWRNEAGKRFAKVEGAPSGTGCWGDFDRDGRADFYSNQGSALYLQRDELTFAKVDTGIERPEVCLAAACGDFDGDGDLDLYLPGYEVWPGKEYADVIYHQVASNRFERAWKQSPIKRARGAHPADFDEDGDLDIYVSNYRLQPNLLWRNDGKGTFSDAAKALKVDGDGDLGAWGHTIGSTWGDLDNDGHLDLFVGNFSHPPAYQDRPKFLRNLGPDKDWSFEDKSAGAGLAWQESFACPALADFDNDGHLDLYFTTVYPGDHCVLYRNKGDWTFENVTKAAGIEASKTYQAAWGDFDNDGFPDLATGGKLYRNPGGSGNWLKVDLGLAIGAQLRVRHGDETFTRHVAGCIGQGNQNDFVLHVGLGSTKEAVGVTVTGPGFAEPVSKKLVPNQLHRVRGK